MASEITILGIRHHGPGSARSVLSALDRLRPNVILIEGPPDAQDLLAHTTHEQMQPPVALLIYAVDRPKSAAFYPFATFSPEWQAIRFGLTNDIPVRFMDLPQAHRMSAGEDPKNGDMDKTDSDSTNLNGEHSEPELHSDPLGHLAQAAGFADGERWWDAMVEQRRDGEGVFAAVQEAMTALRSEVQRPDDDEERQREAFMRQTIRAAQKDGFEKIAVVCGAWHAPALADMPAAKQDAQVLKGLPKTRVAATWVPWTHDRLSYFSGYGAGIESPGWYEHLWTHPIRTSMRWMARVANLMREKDLDASPAQVIEAVRLADALAAMRDRHQPSLAELNEACEAVMCGGDNAPMRLIHRELIVGQKLGRVPDDTPMVPLQRDLERLQKSLRIPASAAEKVYDLDLRNVNDLERSRLLHRLHLLSIPWGQTERVSGRKAGTFHEIWRVLWKPEFAVRLIEAGVWGSTVAEAAIAFVNESSIKTADLPALTELLEKALLADLPAAVDQLIRRIQDQSAISADVVQLMAALSPMVNVARYGDVRKTEVTMVRGVIDGFVARICIGLPGACASLDDDAANQMSAYISDVHRAVWLLEDSSHKEAWSAALHRLMGQQGLYGLVAGKACRLLLDAGSLTAEHAAVAMRQALSIGHDPARCAAWIEGFLQGSGIILLHDQRLWKLVDDWLCQLAVDRFAEVLPLLRRTFSTFSPPERRQMGKRAKSDQVGGVSAVSIEPKEFDVQAAEATLPLLVQILGIDLAGREASGNG